MKKPAAFRTMLISLSSVILMWSLSSCSTTPPTTGPGKPDSVQLQHYEMLKSGIRNESKNDALAALALLNADIYRWQVNHLIIAISMHDHNSLTEAIDQENWPLAKQRFQDLSAEYGHR